MKKLTLIILSTVLLCTLANQALGQTTTMIDSTVLWLSINDLALLPTSNRVEYTDDAGFNQFLVDNGITYYDFKYQGTTNSELRRVRRDKV